MCYKSSIYNRGRNVEIANCYNNKRKPFDNEAIYGCWSPESQTHLHNRRVRRPTYIILTFYIYTIAGLFLRREFTSRSRDRAIRFGVSCKRCAFETIWRVRRTGCISVLVRLTTVFDHLSPSAASLVEKSKRAMKLQFADKMSTDRQTLISDKGDYGCKKLIFPPIFSKMGVFSPNSAFLDDDFLTALNLELAIVPPLLLFTPPATLPGRHC